jgi:hypothetical protein
MRFISLLLIGFSLFWSCEKTPSKGSDDIIVLQRQNNQKYNITAIFYGLVIKSGENNENSTDVVKHVSFLDNKTGEEVKFVPLNLDTEQSSNFYFTNVWSPNEEVLILPLGKREGFGIFEAKEAPNNIKDKKYLDVIKVKSVNSGWFWHDFEKWDDSSTINFKAGLEGNMFAFKYDIAKKELYCYQTKCEEFDIGKNLKGDVKPIKKGDVEPTKVR